jgi:hypothetical protein
MGDNLVTLFLVDIASYQAGMDLAKVKAAGFNYVNIKTSQGTSYVYGAAHDWADKARAQGMGICTFHWLDNSASGVTQANIALRRMAEIGGPAGMAHQCDCEDNATEAIMRSYVDTMQQKLGRHIVLYTGDWWWVPRSWRAADLTPYLWAGPNNGYLSAYPGDTSPHWRAGYGGWGDYSILQYAVQSIAGAGGSSVSKSAIRDPAVWTALTGGAGGDDDMTPEQAKQLGDLHAMMVNTRGWLSDHINDSRAWREQSNKQMADLAIASAGEKARDEALLLALKAATEGGTNLDTAAVVTAIKQVGDDAKARFDRLAEALTAEVTRAAPFEVEPPEAVGNPGGDDPAQTPGPTTAGI